MLSPPPTFVEIGRRQAWEIKCNPNNTESQQERALSSSEQLRAHDDFVDNDNDGDDDDNDDEDDDDADDAHVGGTDALSWELMLSLRTENKQQRPHHDDDGDHHAHQTILLFSKFCYFSKIF